MQTNDAEPRNIGARPQLTELMQLREEIKVSNRTWKDKNDAQFSCIFDKKIESGMEKNEVPLILLSTISVLYRLLFNRQPTRQADILEVGHTA